MKAEAPHLLLVESDPEVLLVIPTFMRRIGEVHVCEDVQTAIELLQSTVVQVLIIANRLLGEDGEKLLQALRQGQPCAQVMLLCEQSTSEVSTAVLADGIGDILVKPFDVAGLPPRLERLLEVMREQQRRARIQYDLEMRMRHHDRVALLGTIVATVAHEVANPLSVVFTNTSVISGIVESDAPISSLDRECLREATKDTFASASVIKSYLSRILRFSRHDGQKSWERDLGDTLSMALLFARARARDRGVHVHTGSLANLPSVPHDAAAFAQAVVNALTNAIDATEEAGTVKLFVEESSDEVTVVVEDEGPGLSEEQQQCLCDVFYTTKETGTGLGTVVIRQVMRNHCGRAEWTNLGEGKGLAVRLVLPKDPVSIAPTS